MDGRSAIVIASVRATIRAAMPESRKRALIARADGALGLGIARFLLEGGWATVLAGRDLAAMERIALWAPLCATEARVEACDVGDRLSADGLIERICDFDESLDAVIVCADLDDSTPVEAGDSSAFDGLMETNLAGTYRVVRGLLPCLSEGGRIVVVTSLAARLGTAERHGAAASHAGVVGMVRALGLELAPKGITVNAILGATGESTPIGRAITPRDVAETLVWILGPGAAAVTGQAINVCGGTTA